MTEIYDLTIAQASSAIAKRDISPVDLTRALIDRITTHDAAIHSFITLTPDLALRQARDIEREISKGERRSSFSGIPYALKDVFDTANIPTTGHSKVFRHRIPKKDAECHRLLKEAGGILIGKLATHEMAHGGPSFDLPWPPARNPWGTNHFTGGSSSGSAAALAARFVPATCGTDTGGSIRGPAALCGISGFMPTAGAISRHGVIPNSITLDRCGPMARTVEDCAMLMDVLAEQRPNALRPDSRRDGSYVSALLPDLNGVRIGVVRSYWEAETQQTPEVISAIERAITVLQVLGATVADTSWLPLRDALDVKIGIGQPEIFAVHAEALRQDLMQFGADFRQRVLPACLFTLEDLANAHKEHQRLQRIAMGAFERFDVLVTISQGVAPPLANHQSIDYWRKLNAYAPANISGGPALSVCAGFADGLPIGMQIIGKPYGDHAVLRVGHAFQQVTDWHSHRPWLSHEATTENRPLTHGLSDNNPRPEPALSSQCEEAALRAGLTVNDDVLYALCRAAPYVKEISERLTERQSPQH